MTEPLEVERMPTSAGDLPRAFLLDGHRHNIRSWGRVWDNAGGRHFLVMTESGRVFELGFDPRLRSWHLLDRQSMFS
ncbi:MAG TPA: hypothetical protein VFI11_02680 [Anaerolineales bacterium]|nr:hypothetical protein [Anaerolineales bacterium]